MRNLILIPAALLALLMLPVLSYTHTPSESHATVVTLPTPTVPTNTDGTPRTEAHSLPTCTTEDGAGMALCYWDAQRQGNGQGTSVVSGDCAPSIMGNQATSSLCVNLHSRDSVTVDNGDGSSNTVPNGPDLIAECTSEFDGSELQECIREWLNS